MYESIISSVISLETGLAGRVRISVMLLSVVSYYQLNYSMESAPPESQYSRSSVRRDLTDSSETSFRCILYQTVIL